ncbi:hypothetical protein NX059_005964 [Plenodomus lindquistii]|nr:hypothetical protein NX059_005964 [Plenodomus lindquistii]
MPSHLRSSQRAYSFPPSLEASGHEPSLPNIDDDPFAHFISDAVDPYELSLSAGIVDSPCTKSKKFQSTVANKWARYVKQSHSNLHSQYHTPTILEETDDDTEETFMQINDDRLYETPQILSQVRGRANDLAARKTRRARHSRTLSGHRHSWREPSPDLFTVDESDEEDASALRRTRTRKPKEGTDRRRSSTRSRSRVRFDVEKARL